MTSERKYIKDQYNTSYTEYMLYSPLADGCNRKMKFNNVYGGKLY